jgi:hypothetical protein
MHENRQRIFVKKILRRIFGLKMTEIIGEGGKLPNWIPIIYSPDQVFLG